MANHNSAGGSNTHHSLTPSVCLVPEYRRDYAAVGEVIAKRVARQGKKEELVKVEAEADK
jgi:hypothetical protein